jgi:predicted Zn finger-like uncharacterized protein
MIVTCPVCSTRYLVDPRALGSAGRLVRCASCAHTWQQAPPADAPRRVDLVAPQPELAAPAGGRVQLPAVSPPPRRSSALLIPLLALLVLIGATAAGLLLARDQVVAYLPGAAAYYAMLGAPVASSTQVGGLGFDKVTKRYDTEDGLVKLVIEGEVVNLSRVARDVPKLRVVLQDSSKHELQSWSFAVTEEPLVAGGRLPFHTSITQPNAEATGFVVTFDTSS